MSGSSWYRTCAQRGRAGPVSQLGAGSAGSALLHAVTPEEGSLGARLEQSGRLNGAPSAPSQTCRCVEVRQPAQRGQRARQGEAVPLVEPQAAQAGQAGQGGQGGDSRHVPGIGHGQAAKPWPSAGARRQQARLQAHGAVGGGQWRQAASAVQPACAGTQEKGPHGGCGSAIRLPCPSNRPGWQAGPERPRLGQCSIRARAPTPPPSLPPL